MHECVEYSTVNLHAASNDAQSTMFRLLCRSCGQRSKKDCLNIVHTTITTSTTEELVIPVSVPRGQKAKEKEKVSETDRPV